MRFVRVPESVWNQVRARAMGAATPDAIANATSEDALASNLAGLYAAAEHAHLASEVTIDGDSLGGYLSGQGIYTLADLVAWIDANVRPS